MTAQIVIAIQATPENLFEVIAALEAKGIKVKKEPRLAVRAKPDWSKAKAKSEDEVIEFFTKDQFLPAADAIYFWNKMVSTDWAVGSRAVRDWRATVRAWKAGKFFPSQKTGPHGNPARNQAVAEIAKLMDDMKYASEERKVELQCRIDLLKRQFGIS